MNEKELNNEELNKEDLENVSGGALFHANGTAADPEHRWEVVDDVSGERIARFATKGEAKYYCKKKGLSDKRIWRYNTLKKMEDAYKKHQEYLPDDTGWKNPHGVL